jgi:uncharacterized protein (DUF2267 family)
MQLQEFLGHVQDRARLSSLDDALRATRATLETLGERLGGGEPANLGGQLPEELKEMLSDPRLASAERFGSDEFFQRVSRREGADLPDAVFHARAVIDVLEDAVTPGAIDHVRDQLPEDYQRLFDAGAEGRMGAP